MNFIGIIPARYASRRLIAKPLIDICGKTMIQRVYEQATKALNKVYIATDDARISEHVERFGAKSIMTSSTHRSGTDRCLEALDIIDKEYPHPIDIIINIQGDEPLLVPEQIQHLKQCFKDPTTQIATLATAVIDSIDLNNNNEVFITFDVNYNALYFSRSVIPYVMGTDRNEWMKKNTFYKHIGLYAYTRSALRKFTNLSQTHLEKIESLEQNRWINYGYPIKIAITPHNSICVDTLEDLERVRTLLQS